ncbi:glycosyltransferase family 4 protein [candidate division KSB1 bacterium]|nr:glycosyltransferase family 4 protein [candidate division KSB1 bacterium]
MVIYQSCGSLSWGGLEMQTLKIARALDARGHDVTLLCAPDSQLEKQAKEGLLRTEPILHKYIPHAISEIEYLLMQRPPHIIHTHLSHDLWRLVPALNWVSTSTALILSKRMASGVSKKDFLHKYCYKRLDRVYAISSYIRRNILETCPIPEEKVELMSNGIMLEMYNPASYNRTVVRREIGIDSGAYIVGMVGRITPKKGHREFIMAADMVRKQLEKPVQFLIVGGASFGEEAYEDEVKTLAAHYFSNGDIRFVGHSNNIPKMMSAMDVLAVPSYEESFGNILLEANAMKLPVVASDSGGVPDIIINRETGLLVPPQNVDALASAMTSLLEQPQLRTKLSDAGRKRIEAKFDFNKYIDRLENNYSELIIDRQLTMFDT